MSPKYRWSHDGYEYEYEYEHKHEHEYGYGYEICIRDDLGNGVGSLAYGGLCCFFLAIGHYAAPAEYYPCWQVRGQKLNSNGRTT